MAAESGGASRRRLPASCSAISMGDYRENCDAAMPAGQYSNDTLLTIKIDPDNCNKIRYQCCNCCLGWSIIEEDTVITKDVC